MKGMGSLGLERKMSYRWLDCHLQLEDGLCDSFSHYQPNENKARHRKQEPNEKKWAYMNAKERSVEFKKKKCMYGTYKTMK